jgi:hypothetical protein
MTWYSLMEKLSPVVMLPILAYALIFASFVKILPGVDWRYSFLTSSILWGVSVTAVTELLSIFNWISYSPLIAVWGIGVMGLCAWYVNIKRKKPSALSFGTLSLYEKFLAFGSLGILLVVGFISFASPPNTLDALSYHMSRVMHWIQNGNVAFYPTTILRQLHQSPWSEFAILQFQVLGKNDAFANSVQWFSMAGSLIGTSLIAAQLGGSRQGQVLTALVVATIPMGIAQGSSVQNDYVLSFWLVCFVYFILLLKSQVSWSSVILCGLSLGLAILTKATAYLFAAPFVAWGAFILLRANYKRGLLCGILIASLVFALNAGHWFRTYQLYGNPLGPGRETPNGFIYSNDVISARVLASNVVRNISNHIGTPYQRINDWFEHGIEWFHQVIGISPNDPRTTWTKSRFGIEKSSTLEDWSGNLLHLISLLGCSLLLLIRKKKDWRLIIYSAGLVLAFLLFCLYLRWQPWNSRLHLPLFVLWSVVIGLVASNFPPKARIIFAFALFAGSLPWVFFNKARPVFGEQNILNTPRVEQYFSSLPLEESRYLEAANFLSEKQCSQVGLVLGWMDFEYPIWVLLEENNQGPIHIEHVKVNNISAQIHNRNTLNTFMPCGIISAKDFAPQTLMIGQVTYFRERKGYLDVYIMEGR